MTTTKQVIAEFLEKFNLNYQKKTNLGYFAGNEKIKEVESFITSKLELRTKEIIELVEGMQIKKPNCDCRTYSMGAHNCDFTSNEAIDDVLSTLKSTYL